MLEPRVQSALPGAVSTARAHDEHAAPRRARLAWARLVAVLGCAACCLALFHFQSRDTAPTPRPAHFAPPALGTHVVPPPTVAEHLSAGEVTWLHFFNPGCPCSRFNLDHVRELALANRGRVRALAVLQGDDAVALHAAWRELDLPFDAVVDADGSVARAYGVYSSPQAVLVDDAGALRFRGNYNVERWCRDRDTQYARIALEALIARRAPPPIDPLADVAYGCLLPSWSEGVGP